jgi:hypothetical protein
MAMMKNTQEFLSESTILGVQLVDGRITLKYVYLKELVCGSIDWIIVTQYVVFSALL